MPSDFSRDEGGDASCVMEAATERHPAATAENGRFLRGFAIVSHVASRLFTVFPR